MALPRHDRWHTLATMRNARRPGPWALVVVLLLAGCAGEDGSANDLPSELNPPSSTIDGSSTSTPGTATDAPTDAPTGTAPNLTPEVCSLLDQDESPLDLAGRRATRLRRGSTRIDGHYRTPSRWTNGRFHPTSWHDWPAPRSASNWAHSPTQSSATAARARPSTASAPTHGYPELGAPPEQRDYCDQLATVLSLAAERRRVRRRTGRGGRDRTDRTRPGTGHDRDAEVSRE